MMLSAKAEIVSRVILIGGVVALAFVLLKIVREEEYYFVFIPWAVPALLSIIVLLGITNVTLWAVLTRTIVGEAPTIRRSLAGLGAMLAGKYLPGKVLGILARTASIPRGTPVERMAAVITAEQLVLAVTMFVVGVPALLTIRWSGGLFDYMAPALVFSVLAVGVVWVLLHQLKAFSRTVLSIVSMVRMSVFSTTLAFGLALLQSILVVLPASILPDLLALDLSASARYFVVSAYALSIISGMVFFLVPGGIGVREGAFVVTSMPVLSMEQAIALAAALRLFNVFNDLIFSVIGLCLRTPERANESSI